MPQMITEDKRVRLLIDTTSVLNKDGRLVVESKVGGKVILRGELGRAGMPTSNNRIYPEAVLNREIGRLQKEASERRLYGELDHPADGRTQFQRVSHRITSISMESDGRIMGEIEIIPTSRGKDLVAIVESGGAVGVSSRGTGTTHKREDGSDIVNEDYTLITYDVVADPAHAGAYPEVFFESREVKNLGRVNMAESAKSLDALIASNPELATQLQSYVEQEVSKVRETLRAEESERLKEEFDKRLLLQLEAIKKEEGEDKDKEDKEKETAAAPASDPAPETPAPAPAEEDGEKEAELAKEKEKVAQLEKKLAEAEETAVQIGMRAKKMALEHVLEKTSKKSSNPSLFMDMIKDKISEDDDADAIKAKIADTEGIIKKIDANMGEKAKVVGDLAQKVKAAVEAEVGSLKTRIEELEQQTADLSKEKQIAVEAASKALEVGKRGYMEAMKAEVIESKAGSHPARAQFRKLLNEANLPDAKSIEKFVEELVRGSRDSKSLQEARTRVVKGHAELLNESGSDAKPSAARRDGDRIFGYSSAEMRKLAGIK